MRALRERAVIGQLSVVDEVDGDDPGRVVGLAVSACGCAYAVGISNTTEHPVRVLVGGAERVLSPSPRRRESLLVGLLLWLVVEPDSDAFDFRAVAESSWVEPVELDGLCVELLLPGGAPCVH